MKDGAFAMGKARQNGHFRPAFYQDGGYLPCIQKTGQLILWLTCEYLVEHRGIEPLTSGLQSLFDDVSTW